MYAKDVGKVQRTAADRLIDIVVDSGRVADQLGAALFEKAAFARAAPALVYAMLATNEGRASGHEAHLSCPAPVRLIAIMLGRDRVFQAT
jgi:hypothetical protein